MTLSIIRPVASHAPTTARRVSRRRTARLTAEQSRLLTIYSWRDLYFGGPMRIWGQAKMGLTPGGRLSTFPTDPGHSALVDRGLIEFIRVEGLAFHNINDRAAMAWGVVRLTDRGREALASGVLPDRLPDVG